VRDLLVQASTAATVQDFAKAVPLIEQALEQAPTHPAALSLMVRVAQTHGIRLAQGADEAAGYEMLLKSAQALRKLREVNPNLDLDVRRLVPQVLYNEACGYCRQQEPNKEKAIASFKEAVEAGFIDTKQIDMDTDLDPIRELPEFKEIREGLDKK
jgi:tetratricopeptide (TPR) repeat protein